MDAIKMLNYKKNIYKADLTADKLNNCIISL